eukprot:3868869-Prymnesium_polylepis.1
MSRWRGLTPPVQQVWFWPADRPAAGMHVKIRTSAPVANSDNRLSVRPRRERDCRARRPPRARGSTTNEE